MKVVIMEDLGISAEELKALEAPFVEKGIAFVSYPRTGDVETMIARAKDAQAMILANIPMPGRCCGPAPG